MRLCEIGMIQPVFAIPDILCRACQAQVLVAFCDIVVAFADPWY